MRRSDKDDAERLLLADELAGIRAEIKALRSERDRTAEVNKLKDDIAELKRNKANLVEENDRKVRETEHKVGLLKTRQDHDVEHARRMAQVEVRESNLDADKKRFADEVEFQRKHMQREVDRFDGIAKALMERLPVIEVELTSPAAARTARKAAAE